MVNSTIFQVLDFERGKNHGDEYLAQFFKQHLFNKLAICSYNKRFIFMESIHFDENENTTFQLKSVIVTGYFK